MTETAIVRKIEGRKIELACISAEGCRTCAGKSICRVKERPFPAENPGNLEIKPGDRVIYELPGSKTITASFMLLIFPLLMFITLFVFGSAVFPGISEGFKVLIGTAGLALGFLGTLLYGRLKPVLPKIISKEK